MRRLEAQQWRRAPAARNSWWPTYCDPDAAAFAERLRLAIVRTPPRVSASIVAVSELAEQSRYSAIESVIAIADEAMHEARWAGGNQSRHRTPDDIPLAS